ncbi:MAG: hypothetical protein N2246_00730 [Candidatus Sumerlaeia bacterium]|nr:hypothetical protein [Candidatus Sumerlaeia bacterium]
MTKKIRHLYDLELATDVIKSVIHSAEKSTLGCVIYGWSDALLKLQSIIADKLSQSGISFQTVNITEDYLAKPEIILSRFSTAQPSHILALNYKVDIYKAGESSLKTHFMHIDTLFSPSQLSAAPAHSIIWLTPHLYDIARRESKQLFPALNFVIHLLPGGRGLQLYQFIIKILLPVIVPLRYFRNPEIARRAYESWSPKFHKFETSALPDDQKITGGVIPMLRILCDCQEYDKFNEIYNRYLGTIQKIPPAYVRVLLLQGQLKMLQQDYQNAFSVITEALQLAKSLQLKNFEASACFLLALTNIFSGKLRQAERHLAESLWLAERSQLPLLVGWSASALALLFLFKGYENKAHHFFDYAWGIFENEGDLAGMTFHIFMQILRNWWLGNNDAQSALLTRIFHLATILRDTKYLQAMENSLIAVLQFIEFHDLIPYVKKTAEKYLHSQMISS